MLDERTGQPLSQNALDTGDPSEAVEIGLDETVKTHKMDPKEIVYLGHGTTVALNMLLERRAQTIGLLTTKGFRDVLEIARQIRPHLYDYEVTRPEPLARRAHRIEIPERVAVDGHVLTPLDLEAVEEGATRLREAGVDAVAICFLHAYRFPDHERKAGEIVRRILPNAFVSLSSDVLSEFREYERSSTAVNAYIGPRMKSYIGQFDNRIKKIGVERHPYIIHSNGGLLTVDAAATYPVHTCLSGPAAGVVGVGGTSTDVSLVLGGRPLFTSERTVAGHPVKSPAVDVNAIGAGGGSIAWIDGGGALKVGPQSAGADPGPVAYGRGGEDVTLTDANIVLGRLNPGALLAGRMKMDADAARRAIEEKIAKPLGLSVEDAAIGIIRVAASGIARAIRSVASAKGHNPADFSLFAYGGAGPLLASDVNDEVGCQRILIPREPGTLCARGILLSDLTFDFVKTLLCRAEEDGWRQAKAAFDELETQAEEWLVTDDVPEDSREFRHYVEARYGPSFEYGSNSATRWRMSHWMISSPPSREHKAQYCYDIHERIVEIVNAAKPSGKRPNLMASETSGTDEATSIRHVHFGASSGWQEAIVYKRSSLITDKRSRVPPFLRNEFDDGCTAQL